MNDYLYIYKTPEALKYFSSNSPSLEERAIFWDENWENWENNQLIINERYMPDLSNMSYFDYVSRGKYIRFRNKEDMLFIKMKMKTK